ncbi:hypothetical protein ACH5RR_021581 [Cinchona calisaya]|uniref:Uncharacterized protein n=1 Tax=Cinchona calisaya TaxID=153742 RepID=A0ABD2ZKM7_9GENT
MPRVGHVDSAYLIKKPNLKNPPHDGNVDSIALNPNSAMAIKRALSEPQQGKKAVHQLLGGLASIEVQPAHQPLVDSASAEVNVEDDPKCSMHESIVPDVPRLSLKIINNHYSRPRVVLNGVLHEFSKCLPVRKTEGQPEQPIE